MKIRIHYVFIISVLSIFFSEKMLGQTYFDKLRLPFSNVCVAQAVNERASLPANDPNRYKGYMVEFDWKGTRAQSGNKFIVELSSPTGDFSSPTQLAEFTGRGRDGNDATAPTLTRIPFQFPTSTAGERYRIRVRSTSPVDEIVSAEFQAYYPVVTSRLALEQSGSPKQICKGETFTLSVDNKGAGAYLWYKDGVLIPNEKKPTLTVTEKGEYYADVDYGSSLCRGSYPNTKTNSFTITVLDDTMPEITIEGGNVKVCDGSVKKISANQKNPTGYIYKWYKDGNLVDSGEGKFEYEVSAADVTDNTNPPKFYVEYTVSNGSCTFTKRSQEVSVTKIEASAVELALKNKPIEETYSGGGILLSYDMKTDMNINVTGIKWFKNGAEVKDEAGNSYGERELIATEQAEYSVRVDFELVDCNNRPDFKESEKVFVKVVEIEKIPNLVARNSEQNLNKKWILPEKYKNGQAQVMIYSPSGKKLYDTTNYDDSFPSEEQQEENKGRSKLYFYIIKPTDGSKPLHGTITVLD